jgi:dihydrofolate reductase
MRKLILKTDVSLDGYMEGPKGSMNWFEAVSGDEWPQLNKLLKSVDTVVMGRGMYVGYSDYWQGVLAAPHKHPQDEVNYARWASRTRHIVFSKRLKKVSWPNMEIKRHVAKDIRALKAKSGKSIIVYGGSKFISTLVDLGLIDEFYLMVVPIALGGGKPLFQNLSRPRNLKRTGAKLFPSGGMWLTYKLS